MKSHALLTYDVYQHLSMSDINKPAKAFCDNEYTELVNTQLKHLTQIVCESFGTELDDDTSEGVRDHVLTADTVAFVHSENTILGFASSKLFPGMDVFYLHGVAIANKVKGLGLGSSLVRMLAYESGMRLFACTTQNPIMYSLARSLCNNVFPNHFGVRSHRDYRETAQQLLSGRNCEFNSDTFVCNNLYSECLYSSMPHCRDQMINDWFAESLAVQFGKTRNGFILAGNISGHDCENTS